MFGVTMSNPNTTNYTTTHPNTTNYTTTSEIKDNIAVVAKMRQGQIYFVYSSFIHGVILPFWDWKSSRFYLDIDSEVWFQNYHSLR